MLFIDIAPDYDFQVRFPYEDDTIFLQTLQLENLTVYRLILSPLFVLHFFLQLVFAA